MHILIVEDELYLSQALAEILTHNGYKVETANNGNIGLEFIKASLFDLVVLDVMMPGMNGFDVLREVRADKNMVPILMLTAKDEVEDKIRGLDYGADDYMTKPFSTGEFLARVRALTRRKGEIIENEVTVGDIVFSVKKNELRCGNISIKLSCKEFQILELFVYNSDQIITKERILSKIWGTESEAEYNNVEVYVSFLRKKLQFVGAKTEIKTLRGMGYILESR